MTVHNNNASSGRLARTAAMIVLEGLIQLEDQYHTKKKLDNQTIAISPLYNEIRLITENESFSLSSFYFKK